MLTSTDKRSQTGSIDSVQHSWLHGEELRDIERAILATITYRDLFDFPVTLEEVHRYLHGIQCAQADVRIALQNQRFTDKYLETDGEYFALKDRQVLFELRRERESYSRTLWTKALAHGSMLASLPFVRMVAVTGSLAVSNPDRDADIDFMLVTDGGRLWSVRLIAKVLQFLNSKFSSGELCVNHLVSTRALELEGPSLYAAQELVQMVPVYGLAMYEQLRARNEWALRYLPNASGAPAANRRCVPRFDPVRRAAERILSSRAGNAIEAWECRRKLHKYNETAFLLGLSTPFRAEATGHRHIVKTRIEAAFADRLKVPPENQRRLRVLFGQAYHLYLDRKLFRAMQPFPPLGSLYAAAVVRGLGHEVSVHDSMLSVSPSEWSAALQINAPDVVVLFEDNFNYLTKMCLLTMRHAALDMIRSAKERGAQVIVCSSDSADEPATYLQAGADFVVIGEGEETLSDLLQKMCGEQDLQPAGIPGLAFLDRNRKLVVTNRRPVIRRIDELPNPAWDLIDLNRYREIWTRRHGRFALNMVTTRGCPYHCNWCAKPIWGQRYNARSPVSVVAEIAYIRRLVDCEYVWFMDDIFGLKPHWIGEFAAALDAAGIAIKFKCLSRPDILLRDGETEALARAGCDIVWMGAESGSQNVLEAMEKGTTVENILQACESLRQHRIRVGLFIQFGYPGETRQDIRATVRMIRQIMPDELGISVSYPLPGTRFYDRVKAELGRTRHWQDSDDLAMLFKGPFNTRFYRALHRYVHSDLAARRTWRNLATGVQRTKLGNARKLRMAGLLLYSIAAAGWFVLVMAVTSRLPHRGMAPLKAELSPVAAATPSDQGAE